MTPKAETAKGKNNKHLKIKNICASQKRKSWTWRIDLWLPDGKGREWKGSGAGGYQIQLRIDFQGDPAE